MSHNEQKIILKFDPPLGSKDYGLLDDVFKVLIDFDPKLRWNDGMKITDYNPLKNDSVDVGHVYYLVVDDVLRYHSISFNRISKYLSMGYKIVDGYSYTHDYDQTTSFFDSLNEAKHIDLKIGDRVTLSSDSEFFGQLENPDSDQTTGTIEEIFDVSNLQLPIMVNWGEYTNSYDPKDLNNLDIVDYDETSSLFDSLNESDEPEWFEDVISSFDINSSWVVKSTGCHYSTNGILDEFFKIKRHHLIRPREGDVCRMLGVYHPKKGESWGAGYKNIYHLSRLEDGGSFFMGEDCLKPIKLNLKESDDELGWAQEVLSGFDSEQYFPGIKTPSRGDRIRIISEDSEWLGNGRYDVEDPNNFIATVRGFSYDGTNFTVKTSGSSWNVPFRNCEELKSIKGGDRNVNWDCMQKWGITILPA